MSWRLRFAVVAVAAASSSAAAQPFEFVVLSGSGDEGALYRVTMDPLSTVPIGPVAPAPAGTDLWELVTVSEDVLLTFDRAGNRILWLDRRTGAVLSVAPLQQDLFITRRGMDMGPDGFLYGLLNGMFVYRIDPATGACTFVVAASGAARVEAIAFLPDGRLRAIGTPFETAFSDRLYSVDLETGLLTEIAHLPTIDLDAMTAAPDGMLYAVDGVAGAFGDLFRIHPDTGFIEIVGTTAVPGTFGITAVAAARCEVDWNVDGQVNSLDISAFLVDWLASIQNGTLDADFTGNGVVNSADISAFLAGWLDAVVQGC